MRAGNGVAWRAPDPTDGREGSSAGASNRATVQLPGTDGGRARMARASAADGILCKGEVGRIGPGNFGRGWMPYLSAEDLSGIYGEEWDWPRVGPGQTSGRDSSSA